MSAFTGWRVLVNFLLPPPMVLAFLLVLPFPRNVRKGLIIFTNSVLSFTVLGGLQFVHLALVLSGVPLIDSGFRTYKSAGDAVNPELTPNQRISVLAKKWREERNFWIAAMTFTLWCLLTVLYAQVNHSLKVNDKLDEVQAELNDLKGIKPAEKAPAGSRLKMPAMPAMPAALANLTRRREDGSAKKHDSPGGGGNTSEVEMETPGPTTRRRAAAGATTATM